MNKASLANSFGWSRRVLPALLVLLVFAAPSFGQTGRGPGTAQPAGNVVELSGGVVVPGQYIIVLQDTVANPAAVASDLARIHGLGVRSVYAHALKGFSAQVPDGRLNALGRDPRVKYIEADQTVQAYGQTIPTGIRRIGAPNNTHLTINGLDDLRIDVDVAVIDTGISDHPDLNFDHARNVDCTGVSVSCVPGGTDGNGHGTHVAGTIGAIDNGSGVVGVAPGARLWGVKVLNDQGSGTNAGVIAGIDWVTVQASTIKVANMSLGGGNSTALCDAVYGSVAAGVTHVVAAGNSNADAANYSPANCYNKATGTGAITVSALADYDGLPGGVAASSCYSDKDDTLAGFSNWSKTIPLIAAPGVCIYSTWKGGIYNTISGTSMATPHVTGAAALLAASGISDPTIIRSTLNTYGTLDWTDDSGDGFQERLLNVSHEGVFNPHTVPGLNPSGTPDTTDPTVSITCLTSCPPVASGTYSGTVPVKIQAGDNVSTGTNLFVTWQLGSGPAHAATWNTTTLLYEGSWNTTKVFDGTYLLTAQATDGANNMTPTPAVTVITANGLNGTYPNVVVSLNYSTSAKNLNLTVTLRDDKPAPYHFLSGEPVSIEIRNGSGLWRGTGTTGSNGTVTFTIRNAPTGTYTTTVTSIDAAPYLWDGTTPTNSYKK